MGSLGSLEWNVGKVMLLENLIYCLKNGPGDPVFFPCPIRAGTITLKRTIIALFSINIRAN